MMQSNEQTNTHIHIYKIKYIYRQTGRYKKDKKVDISFIKNSYPYSYAFIVTTFICTF